MRTRYKGPFRQNWYSLCSKHILFDSSCNLCQCGQWHSVVMLWINRKINLISPKTWQFFMNLPFSRHRRFMKKHFPNVR